MINPLVSDLVAEISIQLPSPTAQVSIQMVVVSSLPNGLPIISRFGSSQQAIFLATSRVARPTLRLGEPLLLISKAIVVLTIISKTTISFSIQHFVDNGVVLFGQLILFVLGWRRHARSMLRKILALSMKCK